VQGASSNLMRYLGEAESRSRLAHSTSPVHLDPFKYTEVNIDLRQGLEHEGSSFEHLGSLGVVLVAGDCSRPVFRSIQLRLETDNHVRAHAGAHRVSRCRNHQKRKETKTAVTRIRVTAVLVSGISSLRNDRHRVRLLAIDRAVTAD
jgi:hypothetical protein